MTHVDAARADAAGSRGVAVVLVGGGRMHCERSAIDFRRQGIGKLLSCRRIELFWAAGAGRRAKS